jgi:plasmid replication initiation protein
MKQLLIKKSNDLVRAQQTTLSLIENKFISHCLGQIYKDDVITVNKKFKVNIEDFAEVFNLKRDTAYREFRSIATSIRDKGCYFPHPFDENKKDYAEFFSSVVLADAGEFLQVNFSEKLLPHISELTEDFTKYRIENIQSLKSSHSIRIYELCKSFAHLKGGFKYRETLEKFKEQLGLGEKYRLYSDVKRIIIKSVEELNKHTDLKVKFSEKKRGKRVNEIIFLIEIKEVEV